MPRELYREHTLSRLASVATPSSAAPPNDSEAAVASAETRQARVEVVRVRRTSVQDSFNSGGRSCRRLGREKKRAGAVPSECPATAGQPAAWIGSRSAPHLNTGSFTLQA